MQRQPYAPPVAHSPPLHHPVPQHVSTVPMMRSPPPPAPSQGGSGYGTPYGGHMNQGTNAAVGGQFAPAFGGFMNDPTAQMGFQIGKSAVTAGQDYMEQNVCKSKPDDRGLGLKAVLNSTAAQSIRLDISPETLL